MQKRKITICVMISILLNIFLYSICFSMSMSFGTEVVFSNNGPTWPFSATTIDENNIFITYGNWDEDLPYDSGKGKAVVATISGTNIIYGEEKIFYDNPTESMTYLSAATLDENRAIIAYQYGEDHLGKARIATITGDSISFGSESPITYGYDQVYFPSAISLDENHVLIAYAYGSSNYRYGQVSLVTVYGSDVVYESECRFNDDQTYNLSLSRLDESHAIVSYMEHRGAGLDYGCSRIITISGTNITYGDEYLFSTTAPYPISSLGLDENHAFIAYRGKSKIAEISGSNISFGSEFQFAASGTTPKSTSMINSNYLLITYVSLENEGIVKIAEISGLDILYSQDYVFNYGTGNVHGAVAVSTIDDTHALISYNDDENSGYGTGIVAEISTVSVSPDEEHKYRFSENKLMNYPNPFSSSTIIEYGVANRLKAESMEINIYNVMGRLVKTIQATNGITELDMNDMTPGIYLYEIRSTNYSKVQKMILMK